MRVVLVEDDVRYQVALEALLATVPGLEHACTFPDAESMLDAARRAEGWDVVLMDLRMPGMGGIAGLRALKRAARCAATSVVVWTAFEDEATVVEAIAAGADGYLVKHGDAATLGAQLATLAAGGAPLSPSVARAVLRVLGGRSPPPTLELTPRERDVLRALVDGLAYKQVADRLGIGMGTVQDHVKSLYRKLGVHGIGEAVARAIRERIV